MAALEVGGGHAHCATCPLGAASLCSAIAPQASEASLKALPRAQQGARAREVFYARGKASDEVMVLCYGIAFRFNRLTDGRRKIHGFLMSGDPISVASFFEPSLPFSVEALTDVQFSLFKRSSLQAKWCAAVEQGRPALVEALGKVCCAAEADLLEQSIDLALRNAQERVASLLLHLTWRMGERQVIKANRYPFPLRQQDIAEFTGLSLAHVNRVIVEFRKSGLIELAAGVLTVRDAEGLRRIGGL